MIDTQFLVAPAVAGTRKLMVTNLPQTMKDEEFSELFATCGKTTRTKIMRNQNTSYSFGYGLVEYSTVTECEKAMDKLNTYPIGLKSLVLTYIKQAEKNVKLNVTGIGPDSSEKKLRSMFSEYGQLVTVKLMRDLASKGNIVGFVMYSVKEEADAAMRCLQGYTDGKGMNLVIRLAADAAENEMMASGGEFMAQQGGMPLMGINTFLEGGGKAMPPGRRMGMDRFNPMQRPMMAGRGGPIQGAMMQRGGGPMRGGPMRGGMQPGGPMPRGGMRGGMPQGGPMRGGMPQGGPMRGGVQGGPMRGGERGRGAMPRGGGPTQRGARGGSMGGEQSILGSGQSLLGSGRSQGGEVPDGYRWPAESGMSRGGAVRGMPRGATGGGRGLPRGGGPPMGKLQGMAGYDGPGLFDEIEEGGRMLPFGSGQVPMVRGRGGPMMRGRGEDPYRMRGGGRGRGASAPIAGGIAGGKEEDGPCLFVYNIGPEATDVDMYQLFSKHGRISEVQIVEGKGFAFVHMFDRAQAEMAIEATNGLLWEGSGKELEVRFKKDKK